MTINMFRQPKNNSAKSQKGSMLMEIVVVSGIIVSSLAAILGLAAMFLTTSQTVQQTSQATVLAQDALEVIRSYRDGTDWSAVDGLGTVTPGALYHPEQSGGIPPAWVLAAGSETIDEFTRQVVFEDVCRDTADDIVTCPGSYTDADSKEVTATVSWTERGRSHQVELIAYFTNWNQ